MNDLERTLSNFSIAIQNMANAHGHTSLKEGQAALDLAIKELIVTLDKRKPVRGSKR